MFSAMPGLAALILVDQPTKPLTTQDRADGRGWTRSSRRLKAERAVRPGVVVMVDVFAEHAFRLMAIDDQQPVQKLAAARADPALGVTVGLGRTEGSPDRPDALVGEHGIEAKGELAVTIAEQKLRSDAASLEAPAQVSGLLGHPWPVGVLGDRDLEDLPACQLDEEENVCAREADRVDGGEVTGHNGARLCLRGLTPGEPGTQPGGWDARGAAGDCEPRRGRLDDPAGGPRP